MNSLLELHEQMLNAQYEKTAATQELSEEMEVLEKYASAADDYLEAYVNSDDAEFSDYDEQDVVKLAQLMIEHDLEVLETEEEAMNKVAELDEAGRIMARSFYDELNNLSN